MDRKANQTWTNQHLRGLWQPSHLSARAHILQQRGSLEGSTKYLGSVENQMTLKFHAY